MALPNGLVRTSAGWRRVRWYGYGSQKLLVSTNGHRLALLRGVEVDLGFFNVGSMRGASCQLAPVTPNLFFLNHLSFEATGEGMRPDNYVNRFNGRSLMRSRCSSREKGILLRKPNILTFCPVISAQVFGAAFRIMPTFVPSLSAEDHARRN